MTDWASFFTLLSGLLLGSIIVWFVLRRSFHHTDKKKQETQSSLQGIIDEKDHLSTYLETQLKHEKAAKQTLQEKVTELEKKLASETAHREEERKAACEKKVFFQEMEKKFENTFKGVASDALQNNNNNFLDLAKTALGNFQKQAQNDLQQRQEKISNIVQPIEESLKGVSSKINEIEKSRMESSTGLKEQIKTLSQRSVDLQKETANLVTALRKPSVRGSWGELQLRRAVEFAGMLERCDFIEQEVGCDEEGRLRPDMVVNLPNGGRIIIDAKTPMESYLKVLETEEESEKIVHLKNHARQLRDRIKELSLKKYWQQFAPTPEFVVLFLPNEALFSAALEQDAELIDFGAQSKVILSTPTTLIALLRVVAHGWQQETIAEHARQISALGRELYERLGIFAGHFSTVGKSLDRAVEAYNKAVRSAESRVLITARKFKEMGSATEKGIPHLNPIEHNTLVPQSEELNNDFSLENGHNGRVNGKKTEFLDENAFLMHESENGFKNK